MLLIFKLNFFYIDCLNLEKGVIFDLFGLLSI